MWQTSGHNRCAQNGKKCRARGNHMRESGAATDPDGSFAIGSVERQIRETPRSQTDVLKIAASHSANRCTPGRPRCAKSHDAPRVPERKRLHQDAIDDGEKGRRYTEP